MNKRYVVCMFLLCVAAARAQPAAFNDGLTDRQVYETWFNSLSDDYKVGALYWTGQRSLNPPGTCYGGPSQQWLQGCLEAKQRLYPSDQRRRTELDYRRGWNSFSSPSTPALPPSPAQARIEGLSDPQQCRRISSSDARLACYDQMTSAPGYGSPAVVSGPPAAVSAPSTSSAQREIDPEKCKSKWEMCSDNASLVNNWTGIYKAQAGCKIAAENNARYGTPTFPWLSFSTFLKGDDAPRTGILTLLEREARFSNGFGAMVHTTVLCKYNLNSDTVANVAITPN